MTKLNEKATKSWVLALASIASCMVALDAMVVTTALSAIQVGLGASLESLEWTVNAYNLSFAVLLLTGTALGDRFGRRRMFCYGIGLFAGGSVACGLATSVGLLIAARALQGAGAALVVPLAMALLAAAFPREERGRALGLFSGVTGVALIAGPVVGGAIAQGLPPCARPPWRSNSDRYFCCFGRRVHMPRPRTCKLGAPQAAAAFGSIAARFFCLTLFMARSIGRTVNSLRSSRKSPPSGDSFARSSHTSTLSSASESGIRS
jgi:MFS family permease